MAKPVCKAEAVWKFWRDEYSMLNKKSHKDKFSSEAKREMTRARRRHFKKIDQNEAI